MQHKECVILANLKKIDGFPDIYNDNYLTNWHIQKQNNKIYPAIVDSRNILRYEKDLYL